MWLAYEIMMKQSSFYICFYINVFYFYLFDMQWNWFSTACGPPEEGFAECCFEEEPLFYMITIIDRQDDEEMVRQN